MTHPIEEFIRARTDEREQSGHEHPWMLGFRRALLAGYPVTEVVRFNGDLMFSMPDITCSSDGDYWTGTDVPVDYAKLAADMRAAGVLLPEIPLALKLLAELDDYHDDYREEWRPSEGDRPATTEGVRHARSGSLPQPQQFHDSHD